MAELIYRNWLQNNITYKKEYLIAIINKTMSKINNAKIARVKG